MKFRKTNLKGRQDVEHMTLIDHTAVIIEYIVIYKVIDCGSQVVWIVK